MVRGHILAPSRMSMLDDHLRILADAHRRTILTSLLEDSPHSVSPSRADGGSETGDVESRERTRIELRHVHLPRLEQSGLIEWNRESDTVARGPEFEEIVPLLELLANGYDQFLQSRLN